MILGETECSFQSKSPIAYTTGGLLITGICLSYIPQFYAIIRRQSSEGISWLMVFLASISTGSNVLNATLENWHTLLCCHIKYGHLQCLGSVLPIVQIGVGWLNTTVLFLLVLKYFPIVQYAKLDINSDQSHLEDRQSEANMIKLQQQIDEQKTSRSRAILAFWLYVVMVLFVSPAVAFTLIYTVGYNDKVTKDYAFSLGIVSMIAIVCQWSPQIWKTFRAKDPGSLSILFLFIQAPGSFLVVIFQAIQYHNPPSTWMSFLLCGIQQTIVLILCIVFEIRNRVIAKQRRTTITEQTPLMKSPMMME